MKRITQVLRTDLCRSRVLRMLFYLQAAICGSGRAPTKQMPGGGSYLFRGTGSDPDS